MRRLVPLTTLALMTMACQEYNLQADNSIYAEPNPPDLSTPVQTDRIVQVTVPSVDVLWVVDNSCSMSEEQAAITTNFPKFVNYFIGSGLDYHIGVVSTGWDDGADRGKLREAYGQKWIDTTTSDPHAWFTSTAQMGTSGPSDEKGRAQVYGALALLGDSQNAGFEREDANLAVVVISDENDASGFEPIALAEFTNWLKTRKADPSMVTFSSIVGPDAGCETAAAGTDYLAVTRQVGGIEWSICNSAWDQVLEELGMQAAGLKREFFLSQVPVPGSVRVWVVEDGNEYDYYEGPDWEYDRARNSIRFHSYVPDPLSEVFIEYEVLASDFGADAGDTGE